MKVFINGGTGFIGSHLINKLNSKNYNIISLRRKSSRPRIKLDKDPKWISDKDTIKLKKAMNGCRFFINCAASGVSPQKASWEELINYNIHKTFSLFILAAKSGIRDFLFLGSEMEASIGKLFSIEENENLNPYSASKATAFILFCSYAKLNNLNLKYIKIPNVYGEGQFSENLWPSLKEAANSGENFIIKNKNTIRNFISVKKVSNIISENLILNDKNVNTVDVINVKGKKMRVGEFAQLHWKKWQANGELIFQEK